MRDVGRVWRAVIAMALAVVASLSVTVATISPAQAAASCYGDYCSGRDPWSVGTGGNPCRNGAKFVETDTIYENGGEISLGGATINLGGARLGRVELWWSARCGTNWAELNLAQGGNIRQLVVKQDTGYKQVNELLRIGQYHLNAGVYRTNMIYSPTRAAQAYVYKPVFWVSTLWA